jgi:hypothetical protein
MLGRKWQELPQLIRFLITNFMDGAAMGGLFGLVLIRLDTGGLGSLLERYDSAAPTALYLLQGGLTFGTLGMAVAVMSLGPDNA